MSGFIPELTTRVHVEVDSSDIDEAINRISGGILGGTSIVGDLESTKNKLESLREPLAESVAKALSSNQENIISSKHYITGMMANSVDLTNDGGDYLVGNTAMSPDGFPYPLAIEKGTRSHWIAPNTFSALHWDGNKFSKGHMVSGIKPDPFVDPSIDDTMHQIDSIVDSILKL